MRIGELAHKSGVSTRALRYYEEQGLLESDRTFSGQRVYPESAIDRVLLIQQLYTAGLSSRLIKPLLPSIDAQDIGPELMQCLISERANIARRTADLQEAGRRLDFLIDLSQNPDAHRCPASLAERPA
ncbi:MerR family transcriptional regulator [Kribbella antibiotica]|uniref:MerR family transcriptional regulator n=1 Tax=Kribbella antibiotica TaxID=190195 RepID=A0A4R4ZS68_9ACTN|nr:MerR family transcriptional regulator [Kribbella antibiotica]TDD60944.1 MerR family transcriptional regulator [Kribbella antibiotica]